MQALQDKLIVTVGTAITGSGVVKSMKQHDSLMNGLLDSSVADIIAGNFTMYGSDVLALVSLSATLSLLAWRVHSDKKMVAKIT